MALPNSYVTSLCSLLSRDPYLPIASHSGQRHRAQLARGRRDHVVERFHETDHISAWSFRGATEGGEPGIHIPRPVVMDSGLAASRRPGMTPHVIRISKSLN